MSKFGKYYPGFLTGLFLVLSFFYSISTLGKVSSISSFFSFVKTFLFLLVFVRSYKPEKVSLSLKAVVGLVLSYGAAFSLNVDRLETQSLLINVSRVFCFVFYSIFLIKSILNLDKNFAILPSKKNIVTTGSYGFIRHPLYSSYLHLAFVVLLCCFTLNNLFFVLLIFLGLLIRAKEEENVLSQDELYLNYSNEVRDRFFCYSVSAPVFLFFLFFIFEKFQTPKHSSVVLNVAYQVVSLKPEVYDDWSSIFVANHIYLSFIPQRDGLVDYSITNDYQLGCRQGGTVTKYFTQCKRAVVEFGFNEKIGCDGSTYSISDFKKELELILTRRNWILKNFQFCNIDSPHGFCIEFDNSPELKKSLNNLFLRFGWSKLQPSKKIINFGFGTHCLSGSLDSDSGVLSSGKLVSRISSMPDVIFDNYNFKNQSFDVGLYGESDRKDLVKFNANTPMGYYIVSNPKNGFNLPWFDERVRSVIVKHLVVNGVASDNLSSELVNFIPVGNNKNLKIEVLNKKRGLNFWLPEFLPKCFDLANELNLMVDSNIFKCVNTSLLISKKVVASSDWDGFLTPLTPSFPSKKSIEDQYFNSSSNEAWITHKNAANYFQLLAISGSLLDLNPKKICGITSNVMGLGDLHVSDFVYCD